MTSSPGPDPAGLSTGIVVVMLGSNIAPERNLPAAVGELSGMGRILAVSSVWQTAAVGDTTQADFCNAAVLLETASNPIEFLRHLNEIEARLGRVRDPRNKNAARTIDLDLAVVPGPPQSVAGKALPDPDIAERVFLAIPLSEVLPSFQLPDGRPITEVASLLQERDAEKLRLRPRPDIRLAR
ncbi:2-amino-4-hydroxy-6-hydroxymethyldihydropteridine pyrophosphokinase [Caulifigura coniformis]|uniref:2-amino-4-hydroxy-6-hydroxymethyldihydropteridine pyrophosphokinase n=1 Tax=Caulifigura coniformis TaxID=2527983 RepID=A0A517SAD0_9PLAN|nr:2-amino-4-hydroxy-6-hydroxymethyldihydropteridine diphosphokinase [Caulifigura coniformis]QDT53090.1 2-amino-4-hydroxy-6-hydroxymethyldihydropteridine pyrophosphokinase [Caulifigura coniformis]